MIVAAIKNPTKNKHVLGLVQRAQEKNDQRAFDEILSLYKKSLYHFFLKSTNKNKQESEDLMIRTFTKAFMKIHLFNPEHTFSTWLFRIGKNTLIDYLRSPKLETSSYSNVLTTDDKENNEDLDFPDKEKNPFDILVYKDRSRIAIRLMDQLPLIYKNLVNLRYFEELTYEEISLKINRPLGTVKAQLHHARKLMLEFAKKEQKNSI